MTHKKCIRVISWKSSNNNTIFTIIISIILVKHTQMYNLTFVHIRLINIRTLIQRINLKNAQILNIYYILPSMFLKNEFFSVNSKSCFWCDVMYTSIMCTHTNVQNVFSALSKDNQNDLYLHIIPHECASPSIFVCSAAIL